MTRTTREEMETTITFSRFAGTAECCTADPSIMRRWKRVGWPVEVLGRYRDGQERTWQCSVPWRMAVRFSRQSEKRREKPQDDAVDPTKSPAVRGKPFQPRDRAKTAIQAASVKAGSE